MAILRYHGYTDWRVFSEVGEDLESTPTYGFELEVTADNCDNRISVQDLVSKLEDEFGNLFVYERDGSIGDGVEIISQPMTWKWVNNNIDKFKKLLSMCSDYGFDSHNGNKCGLHVHVCRQALKKNESGENLNQKNVINNIFFILERYQKEIFKFSRRTVNTMSRWSSNRTQIIKINDFNFIEKEKVREINVRDGNRYSALNLKNNKTIEFRFIRGTLRFETFFISLNLINNIVNFSKLSNHSINFETLVMHNLSDEMKQYAYEYCEKRKIIFNENTNKEIIFLEKTELKNDLRIDYQSLLNDILED